LIPLLGFSFSGAIGAGIMRQLGSLKIPFSRILSTASKELPSPKDAELWFG